ncbi:hypothetical protein K469DRAFT_755566 [Zopfia rhizophila CBS 207.26]|uniref:Uncharacterized protein n=1 Tax=Zopfia rhizophila CBS 207.26 TaxID=1314779 RepID=A0A6A6DC88_9PEZI|nr:hypothetical protein K469DRAFT_755566 [Zopfia rhizophila CBS 207.26]
MPYTGVIEYIEALGLRTYGKETVDPTLVIRRPVFNHVSVLRLYKIEIPHLFAKLIRDDGKTMDREDKNLFDKELDEVLEELGPQIWPEPGSGDRSHLRDAEPGTKYPSDLVYPRDSHVLKRHIRNMILNKQVRPDTDLDSLIQKKGERRTSRGKATKSAPTTPQSISKRKGRLQSGKRPASTVSHRRASRIGASDAGVDSDDSVTSKHTRATPKEKGIVNSRPIKARGEDIQVQLLLYGKPAPTFKVVPYGSIPLNGDGTADDCFAQVCENMGSDCSWLLFRPSGCLSPEGKCRIERGARGSEAAFQHLMDLFRAAIRWPGDPTRICEVECGLELE